MTLGMIVRCDDGGLGNQTFDLARWLQPDRIVVYDIAAGRPGRNPHRFDNLVGAEVCVVTGPTPEASAWLSECDTVLSVETFYEFKVPKDKRVLVANPELYDGTTARRIIVPTPWALDRMPAGTMVVPHPSPEPPSSHVCHREAAVTFLHCAAPAMLDRNGTRVVLDACRHVRKRMQLFIHASGISPPWEQAGAPAGRYPTRLGEVDVVWDSRHKRRWWDQYPPEVDVLLMPRRYGGQSLPVREAAACGIPSVMTRVQPNVLWPVWTLPAQASKRQHPMKGGSFTIYDMDGVTLAHLMDALVDGHPSVDVGAQSREAIAWSRALSWDCMRDAWAEALLSKG